MNSASSGSTGLNPVVREVRGLFRWAVERRKQAMQYGWSRLPHPTMVAQMGRLEMWLRLNPTPSLDTVQAWWRANHATVRYVMPGTAAGKKYLLRLHLLLD